jgi:hypothetical protein
VSYNIPSYTIVMTKEASGNVQVLIQRPNGDIRFAVVIPSADFTSFNSTVNGGSTGATLTKAYTQDEFPNDFPLSFVEGA